MDPNATLEAIRAIINAENSDEYVEARESLDRFDQVMGLFTALDVWIMRGGFLPDVWLTQAIRGQERALARTHVPGDTPFSQVPADTHISDVTS